MIGGFSFKMVTKRVQYEFNVYRKIMRIIGNSATGTSLDERGVPLAKYFEGRHRVKKQYIAGLLAVALVLSGCSGGGGGSSSDSYNSSDSYGISEDYSESAGFTNGIASDSYNSDSYDSDSYDSEQESTEDFTSKENNAKQAEQTIDREMLIYSCDVKIDTLDYEKSVSTFKINLKEIGGFVEHEYYSDGAGYYGYYVEESEKTKNYNATVRIPSQNYESFVTSLGDLGDVRSQSSMVENVSQEYKDASIQLKILEAKETAYLKMLKKAETTEEIMAIQNTLTDLQVQIEQLKSRMQTIETEVAYSFINIEISEVAKYQEKPKETDTFLKRLSNTVKETAEGFLEFLEWLLFTLIRLFPYIVMLAIILPIIFRIKKWYRKKHPRESKARQVHQAQAVNHEQDGKRTYVAPNYNREETVDDSIPTVDNQNHND